MAISATLAAAAAQQFAVHTELYTSYAEATDEAESHSQWQTLAACTRSQAKRAEAASAEIDQHGYFV